MEPTTAPAAATATATATLVERHYTTPGVDPLDEINWVIKDAWPGDEQYENKGLEVPDFWSQQTINIVSKLYLARGEEDEEKSVRVMIERVAGKIAFDGVVNGYFPDSKIVTLDEGVAGRLVEGFEGEGVDTFFAELCYVLVHQIATFNSPVWFNIGRAGRPQCMSACFLLQVDDNSESIMQQATDKKSVFKAGSGAGSNLSRLRGSMESLSTGGTSSGPVSFRRIDNAVGETFKSGGTTRRAADMTQLDADHPDIEDFIDCKVREEKTLRILADAGINIGFDREGERNVAEFTSYQSSNHSVRVSDKFMRLATEDRVDTARRWPLIGRTTQRPTDVVDASELLDQVAQAAWFCADPGVMYDDTINDWHTTPADGKLETTNACGEIHTPNVSSCNLAHLNVLKFLPGDEVFDQDAPLHIEQLREFEITSFDHVVRVMTTAMDILICECELPTPELTERTKQFRWLGLGYANMGAAIMAQAMAYDSDEAREFAAGVTALLTGCCYRQSALLAKQLEPFYCYEDHRGSMERVIGKHIDHLPRLVTLGKDERQRIWDAAKNVWQNARTIGDAYGYRNAQATAIAPTGTTSFMLGCDTTGIEPTYKIVTNKQLAGGGEMVLISQVAQRAAAALGGYSKDNFKEMGKGDFSSIAEEDRPIFYGADEIDPLGHIKMVAAVQPFVSGGVSKTINLDEAATWEEIREFYLLGWKLKVKCLSVYRNNSKVRQILASKKTPEVESKPEEYKADVSAEELEHITGGVSGAVDVETETKSVDVAIERQIDPRMRLPRTIISIRHKIHIRSALGVEHEGYLHAGMYPDGQLGEIFLEGFGKHGGFTQNALGAWATDFSIALQYGVPQEVLIRKHAFVADETGGMVMPPSDKSQGMIPFRTCTSIVDYIARWLAYRFGDAELREEMGVRAEPEVISMSFSAGGDVDPQRFAEALTFGFMKHTAPNPTRNGHAREHIPGPPCNQCGGTMFRAGACWQCTCGNSTGCG